MARAKQKIQAKAPAKPSPTKKVISSSSSPTSDAKADSTVKTSLDVKAAPKSVPVPDPLQAVDYAGNPIKLGMYVDLYFCKVVGLRPDADNRLNLLVVPSLNKIVSADPQNPLSGQVDGKAILVSGFHCIAYEAPTGSSASRSVDTGKVLSHIAKHEKASKEDTTTPPQLPSNFLTPSFT